MFNSSLRVATIAAMLMAGSAFAQEITVTHPQGETVLPGTPEIVLTQDWAIFDNLHALGIVPAGIPSSNAPSYLTDFIPADAEQIGSLFEPDYEGIAAIGADLYLVAGRSASAYPTGSDILPTVDLSVNNSAIVEGVKHNITTLGEIFGLEDRATELNAALDAKVEEARAAAEGQGDALVLVTNAGNVGVYGPDSRVAWVYNELGIPSAMADVEDGDHGGDTISFEFILEMNPDWLFVVDRDAGVGESGGAAAALLDNELVNQTTAAQEGHIVYLDPQASYISMHGYSGLMLLLDQVIEGLTR